MKAIHGKGNCVLRPILVAVAVMLLAGFSVALSAGCGGSAAYSGMKVAASIVPLADFCKNVGGDLVEVRTIVPPGAGCGHGFEPTSGEMRFLSEARVLVTNGLGLESWATDVLKKVCRPDCVEVVTADAVPKDLLLPAVEEEHADGESALIAYDPHVWLDPELAAFQVQAIADGFSRADPAHREQYLENSVRYLRELESLDSRTSGVLAGSKGKEFVATHPTWGYLARHYGIVQAGAVEVLPGKEPSLEQLNELVEMVKEREISTILAEPQLNPRGLEIIAEDSGSGAGVVEVDPVGDPGLPEVASYVKMMDYDARVLAGALQ